MTSYTDASSETSQESNKDSSNDNNTKRNRKTQALSALLSATALGVFLEGCGGGDPVADAPITTPAALGSVSKPYQATAGTNAFTGKAGADWVSYAGSTSAIQINLNDDPVTPAQVGGAATGDMLKSIQNIIGTDEGDTLIGNDKANTLRGGDGGDILRGGAGGDTLDGGAGGDTLDGGAGGDTLDGGAGEDSYRFRVGDGTDTITEGVGDTMTLRFIGTEYEAADFTEAIPRFNRVDNTLVISIDKNSDDDITDQVTFENAYNTEGSLRYTIKVEYGADDGSTPNKVGADVSYWNSRGSESRPFVPTGSGDTFTGKEGADWVSYAGSDAITLTLNDDAATTVTIAGVSTGDTLIDIKNIIGTAERDHLTGNGQANTLRGGGGWDLILGGGGDDTLYGDVGEDMLYGGAGSDIIEGGVGADTLDGGTDTGTDTSKDTLSYANEEHSASLGVAVNLATSTSIDNKDGDPTTRDTISNFENVIGSRYGDSLSGDTGVNILIGGDGDDRLYGNAGNDILEGGVGKGDSYHFEGGYDADTIQNDADGGFLFFIDGAAGIGDFRFSRADNNDVVITTGSNSVTITDTAYTDGIYTLQHGSAEGIKTLGKLYLGATGDDTISGKGEADLILGLAGVDILQGKGGNDILYGNGGNNFLEGDAGSDILYGGAGEDTYIFRVGDGTDTITDGEGETMTLRFIGSAYLAADFAADSTRFARNGNNLVITLVKDSITDKVTINDAYDTDSNTGTGDAAFTINIEYGAEGSDPFNEVTNSFWHTLEVPAVRGSERLPFMATAAADKITGSAGADWVSYEGLDRVQITLSDDATVAATVGRAAAGDTLKNIQNIIGSDHGLVSTNAGDSLIGNGQANIIYGKGGNDLIRGENGNDILYGGAGHDTLYGHGGDDILDGGAGDDAELYGNDGDDTIYGGVGVDGLYGNNGKDTLDGGAGDDQLRGGAHEDTYIFRVGDGTDDLRDVAENAMTLRFIGADKSDGQDPDYEEGDFLVTAGNFARVDNKLVITLDSNKVTINNAYNDDAAKGTGNSAFTINIEYGTEGNFAEIAAADGYWSGLTAA